MDTQSHPGRRGLLRPNVPTGRPTRRQLLPCPPHRPQLAEQIHNVSWCYGECSKYCWVNSEHMRRWPELAKLLLSLMFPNFTFKFQTFSFHAMGGACKTPGDQGGVGRHVQCLPNTLSETDHGHHHENCTCTCAEVEGLQQTSDSESHGLWPSLAAKTPSGKTSKKWTWPSNGRCGSLMRSSYNFLTTQSHVISIHFCWCVSGNTFKGKPFTSSDTEWK